jgi:hypothetical protein
MFNLCYSDDPHGGAWGMAKNIKGAVLRCENKADQDDIPLADLAIEEFIYCRATKDTLAERIWRYGSRIRGWYVDPTSVRKVENVGT